MAPRKTAPSRKKSEAATVTRVEVLHKFWELANLDPEATKGTITGQLKALELLIDQLGQEPESTQNRAGQPEIYRAAWLDPVTSEPSKPVSKRASES